MPRVTKIPGIARANGQECNASLEVKITIESLDYTHIFCSTFLLDVSSTTPIAVVNGETSYRPV